ncbi:ABC transporter ATP-binding protein [Mesorhizobium sp. CO1-1-8]|uniref:ABC transporter ATP-binding protein n=1 Tax=Mesorhizobium sp. CO1-1-8 TaxID=2876631 RepID=UPI001CD1434F|nr:ABC transporter ATP-binding protein [Mesorhizobium sp. CO1-1-8]MBZ9772569.1 ABC transporter ATP-binding protein [Mesorhizobium sp. CO1-1-8]
MALLEVQGVGKAFGSLKALNGVNFSVADNTFHGLIGPNGSGKSTLLKAIAGAHFASEGAILFNGRDITTMSSNRRARLGLSLKFQITAILPELSLYDNVLLAKQAGQSVWPLIRSRSRSDMHAEVMESLKRFGLDDRADDLASDLSHGQQQWLEIAMSLIQKPKLLLLDEPTGGLSPEERRSTGELLMTLKEECALIIVEHDLDFIKDICDTITVLDQGSVLYNGNVDDMDNSARVKEVYTSRV